jgi:4'-phosphopantetheinyl transferase EntD
MLEALLPVDAAVSETRGDVTGVALFPEEEAAIRSAVDKRRLEFATARCCARDALAKLGRGPRAIPSGADGAPVWPVGIVGSITHCDGYRACVVAPDSALCSVGVDAEPDRRLPAGVLEIIALPGELATVAALSHEEPALHWDRLLFCMKEAVYKAWHPLVGGRLRFEDVEITIEPIGARFSARPLIAGPIVAGIELGSFSGMWAVDDGIALAAVAVPVRAPSGP